MLSNHIPPKARETENDLLSKATLKEMQKEKIIFVKYKKNEQHSKKRKTLAILKK